MLRGDLLDRVQGIFMSFEPFYYLMRQSQELGPGRDIHREFDMLGQGELETKEWSPHPD